MPSSTSGEPPPDAQSLLYRLVALLCRPVVRLLFRLRAQGLDRVPARGGFVLSANQLSNLDGFALAHALYPRQPRRMGKAELFMPVVGPVLRRLGIFPVRRGTAELEAGRTRPARRLWPRLLLDVSLRDLLFALAACGVARRRDREQRVLGAWAGGDEGLVCRSVRSGLDLLLQALAPAPGTEVLV